MINQEQQQRQHLTNEVNKRRERLEAARRDLAFATATLKRTGSAIDGQNVTKLAEAVRIAEISLDGATESLAALNRPRRVVVSDSPNVRTELQRERAEIVQKRDYRHKQHEEQVEAMRQRCKGMPEAHVKIVLNNTFGGGERSRRDADEFDAKRIAHIDAQLAELDRRQGARKSTPSGHDDGPQEAA
ncbi:MAG TPA: hypothetical protein VFK05_12500 [Polyangiaceae bacterium]|nr:hypothetical protein [Polyangiaceae bacterium]